MQLTLAAGRRITLASLEQWRTYDGLLAGKPGPAINRSHVEELLKRAKEHTADGGHPMLIQPSEAAISGRLPAVTCVAVFESGEFARADSEPYSSLTVAWFQHEFALPIDQTVESLIRTVDWESAAKDYII